MPNPLDLFDHELVFAQRPLLAVGQFHHERERRGVQCLEVLVEALPRAGVVLRR